MHAAARQADATSAASSVQIVRCARCRSFDVHCIWPNHAVFIHVFETPYLRTYSEPFSMKTKTERSMPTQTQAPDRLVTANEAAVILGFSTVTLAAWRWRPRTDTPPPPYVRIGGRSIRYRQSDLLTWIEERASHGTTKSVARPRKAR